MEEVFSNVPPFSSKLPLLTWIKVDILSVVPALVILPPPTLSSITRLAFEEFTK